LLDHSLAAIAASETLTEVVIAAPSADHRQRARELLAGHAGLSGEVVEGGATRAESVARALTAVDGELVLVHDAARPLAPPALFDAIVARLGAEEGADAVVAAAPIADTVKRSREPHDDAALGIVASTVSRDDLWIAQTPQGFRVERLRAAQRRAEEAGELAAATDEAGLIEAGGGIVLLERSPASNIKVTDAADLRLAGALLAGSGRV
jgi:2-C-methyl-D-erythritol 4-phosphate cytidylyltransferase